MRVIELTASPDGSVKTETKGYEGVTCHQADAWLRAALGITQSDRPTGEAFATTQQQQEVNS